MKCVVCGKPFSLSARCTRNDCPKGNLEMPEIRSLRAQHRIALCLRYEYELADERARTKRWRAAFFMAVATIAAIVALIGFNTHAGAFDHGFSDLPLPHSDEMQWVESRKMPGTPPRKASCCGKGDMYYADVYKRNPDGSYEAEITDGSPVTYPDGDHRVEIKNGTKFHIGAPQVNPPEDGNPLGHGVVFLGIDDDGHSIANVWCFFPMPQGS